MDGGDRRDVWLALAYMGAVCGVLALVAAVKTCSTYHCGGAAMNALVSWLLSLTAGEAGGLLSLLTVSVATRARVAYKWGTVWAWGPVAWLCRDTRPAGVRAAYAELGGRLLEALPGGDIYASVGHVRLECRGVSCFVHPGEGKIDVGGERVEGGLSRRHRRALFAAATKMLAAKREADDVAAAWKLAGGR